MRFMKVRPMQKILSLLALVACCHPATAGEISSAYTDLDPARNCTTFTASADGEGDWANLVCNGYRGYPILLYTADLRESVFYGFPPGGDLAPAWESFSAFNSVGPKIEWRIEKEGATALPFAAIQRWKVSDAGYPAKDIEILVVEKIGQIDARDGCAVGLVLATGNPDANAAARKIADETAKDFACGTDERVVIGKIPDFSRAEN